MKKIAVEEHISIQDYIDYLYTRKTPPRIEVLDDPRMGKITRDWLTPEYYMDMPLVTGGDNRGDISGIHLRLEDMDKAGINMQVLSMRNPGIEEFEIDEGITWARRINNELARIVDTYPDRFAAFAMIPWQDADAAVKELERAVKELGLKGVKTQSHIKGEHLDKKKYWPIFQKAAELDVPVFIHPREPCAEMLKPYLAYPGLAGAGWGYQAEVGLHAMLLIYSGLFDAFPKLKIILGHMGEGLPFWLFRMDGKGGTPGIKKKPSEYVKDNFFVATSGMFSQAALMCSYLALGADNILFAVDYPPESNIEAAEFIDHAPICPADREKICHLNAERLLKLRSP